MVRTRGRLIVLAVLLPLAGCTDNATRVAFQLQREAYVMGSTSRAALASRSSGPSAEALDIGNIAGRGRTSPTPPALTRTSCHTRIV